MIPAYQRNVCNAFLKEFTLSEKATIKTVEGEKNKKILEIFLKNFSDIKGYRQEIKCCDLGPSELKEKALTLGTKHLKLHRFKYYIGGKENYDSFSTKKLAGIYSKYLTKTSTKEETFTAFDKSHVNEAATAAAKAYLSAEGVKAQPAKSRPISTPKKTGTPPIALNIPEAKLVKLNDTKDVYSQKIPMRTSQEFTAGVDGNSFNSVTDAGGAANVGADIYKNNPNAKIGVMIAGNHGLFGGALGKEAKQGKVEENDLTLKTQEESVWANAVLSKVGNDSNMQKEYYQKTLNGKWGMKDKGKTSTNTATVQGIDYTKTKNAKDYYLSMNVTDCFLSRVDGNKKLTKDKSPVLLSFTAGPNANPKIGTPEGTMQRTLNQRCIKDYAFFCECIEEALRSSLDGMAKESVTHAIVASISCGIYAGAHQAQLIKDYDSLVNHVLNEVVGPNGQKRGQYFQQVTRAKV